MPKKPETVFKERVAVDLKALPNCWFCKIQQVTIRGTPDFLLCINGYFVALELKASKTAIVSPIQEWTLREISKASGLSLLTHPGNWKETYVFLAHMAEDQKEELAPQVAAVNFGILEYKN